MSQSKYQPISTIKISAKEKFYWVKYSTPSDPDCAGILQSYSSPLSAEILRRAQWEIDRLLPLNHPNLQAVIDIFATDNSLNIVQQLGEWECVENRAPFTPAQAEILLQEIIPVLIYLHDRGITHGNISPETIAIDEHNRFILTNFLPIVDLITEVGGDTFPRLRSQLEQISVLNMPTGQAWDLYSLGVTVIALLTNQHYQDLYDYSTNKWNWNTYINCSKELTIAIDRLLDRSQKSLKPSIPIESSIVVQNNRKNSNFSIVNLANNRVTIGLLLFGIFGLLSYLIWQFIPKFIGSRDRVFSANKTLIVGYINRTPSRDRSQSQQRDYPKFKSYLETELRKKYGNDVKVELRSVVRSKDALSNIKEKKWDLIFALSATNSLVAEDNKYEFIARMSANEDPYRDVCFFVKQDSKINSTKDFTIDRTIALPNDDSPIFIMPLYDLYGKKMRVSLGNTLSIIEEKVKSGQADVGVGFCKTISQKQEFRTLSPNRIIPVGGVFLSPNIKNTAERDYIKEVIYQAPDEIQRKANYTRSTGINYDRFRRVNERVNRLLDCVDFTRNPVDFYCTKPSQSSTK
jgi:serine/threonine protein kinase